MKNYLQKRIFLSSTAIDLEEYRLKAKDVIRRLDYMPVAMEDFGADPLSPVELCKEKISSCDAIVIIVAHRYGWIPSIERGGDGVKSITWIELETAASLAIPIFAYIIDERIEWGKLKEQDLIANEDNPEKIDQIIINIKSLKELKRVINSEINATRDIFINPDNLGTKIATGLAKLEKQNINTESILNKRENKIHYGHHLLPAMHFRGRKKLLDNLITWWDDIVTPDRAISLVAMGGVGKTAILSEFIKRIKTDELRGDVFIWSFYDDPNVNSFFIEACKFFGRNNQEEIPMNMEGLCNILAKENRQHIFVLDGLERIQADGKQKSGRSKGSFEDSQVKNFFINLVVGIGNTRIIVTSRFRLIDLIDWDGAGYKAYDLDLFDDETAIEVLRAWNIKGTKKDLILLAESVGHHALSISVLGAFLNRFGSCDSKKAAQFKLSEMSADIPQAGKLERILERYSAMLPEDECTLLRLLSVFPDGVSEDSLIDLLNKFSFEIVGILKRISIIELKKIVQRLNEQGLIYGYEKNKKDYYVAHPFLRDYFSKNLLSSRKKIHKVVGEKILLDLEGKPGIKPKDNAILDEYESLINHYILAEEFIAAYDVYIKSLDGGSPNGYLFYELNDYSRIARIISKFTIDNSPEKFTEKLTNAQKCYLINDWGLATLALGDLQFANSCFKIVFELQEKNKDIKNNAIELLNLSLVSINRGLFPEAKKLLELSLTYISDSDSNSATYAFTRKEDQEYLGFVYHCLGEIELAKRYFIQASELSKDPISQSGQQYFVNEFYEIIHKIDLGEFDAAKLKADESLRICEDKNLEREKTLCFFCLGILTLQTDINLAKEYLDKIKKWAGKSGYIESKIHSYILASRIYIQSDDIQSAEKEAKTGYNIAEHNGFTKLAIDLSILLSSIYLKFPNYVSALRMARRALEKSLDSKIMYKWGEANALHHCSESHYYLDQNQLALDKAKEALRVRKQINHPGISNTENLLIKISA